MSALDRRNSPASSSGRGGDEDGPSLAWLATHRPRALLSRLPEPLVLFTAGALAGAVGKTATAPLDRLKIIMQVRGKMMSGALSEAAKQGNVVKTFLEIGRGAEGIRGYWRGNLPQVVRVIPYSAAQLCGYELFKKLYLNEAGELPMHRKLAAGASAGMLSTLVTYPLDTLRLRLAVDSSLKSIPQATAALWREGRGRAMFKGLGPALLGIAPYMALELATYDSLPKEQPAFARGFCAALVATSCCYPLDTLRRQVQVQAGARVDVLGVVQQAFRREGVRGFYRGFCANALKNLPNKGIRLSVFTHAKQLLEGSREDYALSQTLWSAATSLPSPEALPTGEPKALPKR